MQAAGGLRCRTMVKWSRTSPSHRTSDRGRDVHGQALTRISFPTCTRSTVQRTAWRGSAALQARNGGHRASPQQSAHPSDADDPTTDFDLFHALIRKGAVNVYRTAGT